MKKLVALFLCLMLALPVFAVADDTVEITLWTYPIGSWGNAETVDGIIASFNAVHPEIKVTVQYLDYTSGDDQVTTAIEAKTTPDIIMEGPERLVANWGAAGKMLDISDLWDDAVKADIIAASPAVEAACKNGIESVRKCSGGEIENQTVEGYETKKHPKFEVYADKAGDFRYRLKAGNGQIVATGGVGYKTVGEVVAVAECVKAIAADAPIENA